ncbi:MAG: hypothetical protein ONB05_09030 [candidate division KSB1 bacterium]|nr:hypothetical protein [candidate division KSB1 bacterium]
MCGKNTGSLQELILQHQQTKEIFTVQDAYKLLYQSIFGVTHILGNTEAARQYLSQEYESIDASLDEPLIEPISLNQEIVRINLRPFKARKGSPDKLFQVMISSAQEIQGNQLQFMELWQEFKALVYQGKLKFDLAELETFDQEVAQRHYPCVHHSEGYRHAHRPSYRVVKRKWFEQSFPLLG